MKIKSERKLIKGVLMKSTAYLMKRIAKMDYKQLLDAAKFISTKTGKLRLLIIMDMIQCGIIYKAGYCDYREFEFYNLNRKQRLTYLTRGKNNEIVRRFNDKASWHKFDDKIEFNALFQSFLHRDWMAINGKNFDEFLEFFKAHPVVIVKPADSIGGKGIEKCVFNNEADCRELYEKLYSHHQWLVEECIVQHPDMDILYSGSVNTMRIFTFLKDNQAYFLQAILKIGNGGVVDNYSSGGMYTFADEEGTVFAQAIDQNDEIYSEHPLSKQKIVGFKIPMFKEAVQMTLEAAKIVPEIAYIGWDIAIGKNGPLIVEGNCYPGVFQVKPSLCRGENKEGLIPKYEKIMGAF